MDSYKVLKKKIKDIMNKIESKSRWLKKQMKNYWNMIKKFKMHKRGLPNYMMNTEI